MSEFNDWGVMFLAAGAVMLALMIYIPAMKDRSPLSGSGAVRHGLNGLLESYRKLKNRQIAMTFGPLLIFPGLFLARDPGSFFACMSVTLCGLLLIRRTYSTRDSLSADYRKEAAAIVSDGGKNALALLEKLDGEVRRGAVILQSGNDYYLFPSAVVAGKGRMTGVPWIVPTGVVTSMIYAERRGEGRILHCVFLYDERGKPLCVVRAPKKKDASVFMSEMTKRFGTRETKLRA